MYLFISLSHTTYRSSTFVASTEFIKITDGTLTTFSRYKNLNNPNAIQPFLIFSTAKAIKAEMLLEASETAIQCCMGDV